ncbi:MAG: hypothetical protein IH610_07570 [Deltaproteobacteria bacterium]|jgi:hypothetical protein|nr:hypothetical protein [Deltaproteobacteria bacterium]TFH31967.1 MAG: hypothetical protein E4G97_03295 [Deltaproteobacteria bacterium]
MERGYRTWTWTALAAVVLLLCAGAPGIVEAGSPRRGGPPPESVGGKSIRLSLKISGAKKRKRQVSFYKSVARQAKRRTSGVRSPSSGR